jgi:hypothetical protein
MRRRPAGLGTRALGATVLGVTGLIVTGLTGCSTATSAVRETSGTAQAASTTAQATTATAQGTTSTAAATSSATVSRAPVDRYMQALLAVRGTFEMVGGPLQPGKTSTPTRPLAGVVTFRDSGGHTLDVTVGTSGAFSVNLVAGSYTVTGRSKQIEQQNPDGSVSELPCSSPLTLTVRPGAPAHVTVVCAVP